MRHSFALLGLLVLTLCAATVQCAERGDLNFSRGYRGYTVVEGEAIPPVTREFRGAWLATVANIDWPSKPGLSTERQQAELVAILDKAVLLRLNAIVMQVRPACDALYASKLEPWSEYLTGVQGQAPSPYYDPLTFAVAEAHKRGLELHAWFNPYRAKHPTCKSPLCATHISKTQSAIVCTYGEHLWLDPGEKATQEHSLAVVMDVLKRYDIDGVHLDDYFYPYHESKSGKEIPFPDTESYKKYLHIGGKLDREDWRRENVNVFVQRLYKAVKAEKPWVKFGVSPFGIWRPHYPQQIKGFDAYVQIYCDSRKWLTNGWLDYVVPQLYWPIARTAQSYPVLLKWWVEQNKMGRHVWAGNYTSMVAEGGKSKGFPPEEIVNEIKATRRQSGASGNVHFSMKTLERNTDGLSDQLIRGVYALPTLIPASPWLGKTPPAKPKIKIENDPMTGAVAVHLLNSGAEAKLSGEAEMLPEPEAETAPTAAGVKQKEAQEAAAIKKSGGQSVARWVVQTRVNGLWSVAIVPVSQPTYALDFSPDHKPDRVAVSVVDRVGNQSTPVIVKFD